MKLHIKRITKIYILGLMDFFLNISKLYVIINNNDEMSTFLNFRLLMLIRYDVIKFI